ncbi:hypothetical protein [Streptosporangium sp. NPDC048865]|uniref:MoaF-related domain-containing protein n=1 Tax=Streptosporangium sp. NPDC048865 TaxID=3155766 RepID=UPI003429AC98
MRDDVHLNSWTEASGATVTHVENFANAPVYSEYVTSQNERTTAMNDQNQQEVTIRDNPDKGRFDVLVGDTHAGFSMLAARDPHEPGRSAGTAPMSG